MAEAIESHTFRALLYFLAGAASLWAGKSAMDSDSDSAPWLSRQTVFWIGLAAVLLALGLLKGFDVEQWAARQGRDVAYDQGWYEQRRGYQEMVIGVIAVLDALAFVFGFFTWARRWMFLVLPLVVLVGLVGFVSIRAISLHQIDAVLYRRHILDIQVSAIVEVMFTLMAALIAIISGIFLHLTRDHSTPRPTPKGAAFNVFR